MKRLHLVLLAAIVLGLPVTAGQTQAGEPIRFGRTPDISPDGKLVAFSYLGDIWTVDSSGGVARPVTMHENHEIHPVFSPNGRSIAFSSNRHGQYDVFVVPVQGGKPARLTFDSADDYVTGWSSDGQFVLFSSTRANNFPTAYDMYKVPVGGGKASRLSVAEGREGVLSPNGELLAYVRGPGTWYRKSYRGSSNDDLWLSNADGVNNRRITQFDGQDNSPMWGPDGKTLYYVSENGLPGGAPANIVRQEINAAQPSPAVGTPQILTNHREEAVRKARISANGEWIVYECGPDLWVVSTKTGVPSKLAIEVNADDKANPDRTVTFTQGASEFAVSPDELHIAFVVHGEIFLMPRGGGKAKRLTDSPAFDHNIAWSPDSKRIIFLSDRGGQEDVYLLEPNDPDHPELAKAHAFKVKQLTNTPEGEGGLYFTPDGKRISFLRAGKLVTMDLNGGDVKVMVHDGTVIDYEWSPDGKWLAYSRMDGSWASELFIVPATGATAADPARNVTRFATYNAGITWSKTANRLAFLSERRGPGSQTVFVMSMQKPAVKGAAPALGEIDFDDIHLRVRQPVSMSASEAAISRDGLKVAFRSQQGGDDLWVASVDGKDLTRLTTGGLKPSQIQWSRGPLASLLYFSDGTGQLRMLTMSGPTSGGTPALVPFQAKMTVRRQDDFAEMFEQSWRALNENFYDPRFHGANWKAVRDKYRPLVSHVSMKEDLYALVSLMLGELNASHLGIQGLQAPPEQQTADLGLLFDEFYRGPGLKITEILKRGPADKRGIHLKAGDIILGIDGVKITEKTEIAPLLNDKIGDTLVLQVSSKPADPKATRRVEVEAASRQSLRPLLYERWVAGNAKRVAELSQGKVGYIHIPSMDDEGLNVFTRALYSDNFDKEAIVLDVRFNGGGFTHDKVLNFLGGKEHTFFIQRNGGTGAVLRSADRKWHKPLVLLINNRSYSDAEIFPHAFRALGLGKLVGQPTGAHVIGTTSVRLIDGSTFRVPRTGVFTYKGVNMEREGVVPDVIVEAHPDQLARGIDAQLDRSVAIVLADLTEWKKTHPGIAFNPAAGGIPSNPVITPAPAPSPGSSPPMTNPTPKKD